MGSYVVRSFETCPAPVHVLFCLVDHFEPGHGNVPFEVERGRMNELLFRYPALVEKHRDSSGTKPKRTWFFPPHYHRNGNLRQLVSLCQKGFGEIELHLHHGKTKPDTAENLEKTILHCVEEYSCFGIFGTEGGVKKYGFIHGDWALDNSLNGEYCGVNNEIDVLIKTGCYADFTFPSLIRSNPLQLNSIYYAHDHPMKPKSYNFGLRAKVGRMPKGGLLIIQGPTYPYFLNQKASGLRVFGDAINGQPKVTDGRIACWIRTGIHVQGKRNWIVLKMHTHGATASEAVLGREIDRIFTCLEKTYNDGKRYNLHYVTARELYNIIKAAEAGEPSDNPEEFRDYRVDPPVYDSTPDVTESSERLRSLVGKTYK